MASERRWQILSGDCLEVLRTLATGSVHTCISSPPFYNLRDYGTATWEGGDAECDHKDANQTRGNIPGTKQATNNAGEGGAAYLDTCGKCGATRIDSQIGLEPTPDEYVAALVAVYREVWRVLRDDGTVWLNLGDSYNSIAGNYRGLKQGMKKEDAKITLGGGIGKVFKAHDYEVRPSLVEGLKPKDLIGIPWRVAFALQADGWYLRQDIIWHKPNPMPESVTDRCTKAHEYLFLLTKRPRYYYDHIAIQEAAAYPNDKRRPLGSRGAWEMDGRKQGDNGGGKAYEHDTATRNKRSVWTVTTQGFPEAHFATFPEKLIEPCVLAGTSERGCCPECGAPWVRVVEKFDTGQTQKMADGWDTGDGGHGTIHRNGREQGETNVPVMGSKTTGWRPSCLCYPHADEWVKLPPLLEDETDHDYLERTKPERSIRADLLEFWAPLSADPCTVLDHFSGAGTTGVVAVKQGRRYVGIELNPEYAEMSSRRLEGAVDGFALFAAAEDGGQP